MQDSSPYNFAVRTVDHYAREPDRVALQWFASNGDLSQITFHAFSLRSNKVANMLQPLGVQPGRRVLILLPLCPEWWESILGVMKTGGVAVLGEQADTHQVVANQINRSQASVVIADRAVAPMIDELAPACPGLKRKVVIGWEREGWTDYDRRVSLAPAACEPAEISGDDPCLMFFPDDIFSDMIVYPHNADRFDLEFLDAWRNGDMLVIREEPQSKP